MPSNLFSVKLTMKHYFPGHIKSGYIMSDGKRITSGLDTMGGQLMVNVPVFQLSFVQKLHMTTSRASPLRELDLNKQLPAMLLTDKRKAINEVIIGFTFYGPLYSFDLSRKTSYPSSFLLGYY